jgi:hypothetical protein
MLSNMTLTEGWQGRVSDRQLLWYSRVKCSHLGVAMRNQNSRSLVRGLFVACALAVALLGCVEVNPSTVRTMPSARLCEMLGWGGTTQAERQAMLSELSTRGVSCAEVAPATASGGCETMGEISDAIGRVAAGRGTYGEACAQIKAEQLQLRALERGIQPNAPPNTNSGYSQACGFEPLRPNWCLNGVYVCACPGNQRANCYWQLPGC